MKIQFRLDILFVLSVCIAVLMLFNLQPRKLSAFSVYGWPYTFLLGSSSDFDLDIFSIVMNALIAGFITFCITRCYYLLRQYFEKRISAMDSLIGIAATLPILVLVWLNVRVYPDYENFGKISIAGKWPTRGWPFPCYQTIELSVGHFHSWHRANAVVNVLILLVVFVLILALLKGRRFLKSATTVSGSP